MVVAITAPVASVSEGQSVRCKLWLPGSSRTYVSNLAGGGQEDERGVVIEAR